MTIQVIGYNKTNKNFGPDVVFSCFAVPKSLDEYDINIIDVSSESLWRFEEENKKSVNCFMDLKSVQQMAERSKKTKIIYIFPQNCKYKWNFLKSSGRYQYEVMLKDILQEDNLVEEVLNNLIYTPNVSSFFERNKLYYEKTKTVIGDVVYNADFYFSDILNETKNVIVASEKSDKPTAIFATNSNGIVFTTLSILESHNHLMVFIKKTFNLPEEEPAPNWINDIEFYDDRSQQKAISEQERIINKAKDLIKEAKERLQNNSFYKSALYKSGEELVKVVFPMLEKMLACDLSKFKDENKEDFLIKKDSYTLIGEIKGVSTNVKNEHISQVDVHFQSYLDNLAEKNITENAHQILIINTFRNKPLSERDPVNEEQIRLAERNKCLVIETATLLKLFEQFVLEKIDTAFCERIFTEKTGLLRESDVIK